MEKNVLKVRMLGTFSLEYKGKELVLDRNKTSKTTQLFQLLMFHTEDGGSGLLRNVAGTGRLPQRGESPADCRFSDFVNS